MTDNDLIEVEADWEVVPSQTVLFEKIILVGSEDFSLVGRPIIPRDIASVSAVCVEGIVKTYTPYFLHLFFYISVFFCMLF